MKTILKKKHSKDCLAMQVVADGNWKTPWAFPKETFFANRFGNKSKRENNVMWIQVGCNDPSCPAEIWVENESIMELLPNEEQKKR